MKRITCRVCSVLINEQSYPDHLKSRHPEEDPKDRRAWGQQSLARAFFASRNVSKRTKLDSHNNEEETLHEDVEDEGHEDIDDEGHEDIEEEGNESHNSSLSDLSDIADVDEEDQSQAGNAPIEPVHADLENSLVSINRKLDDILETADLELDFSNCASAEEEMQKRLDVIKKLVNVKQKVNNLTSASEELKLLTDPENKQNTEPSFQELSRLVLLEARSMKEITDKLPQFEYDQGKRSCRVRCAKLNLVMGVI